MPVLFDIRSASADYEVIADCGALADRGPLMREGIVIADAYFARKLSDAAVPAIVLEANEFAKSLDALSGVIVEMRARGATRGTHLWAVGGGAIQDVAGFVASIYMRGLSWTYVPTTLLGMVDSCIGGKSSINVLNHKNLVGTFHPPCEVLIDPMLTATLSVEQQVAGLVEAAKICYCRGAETFAGYLAQGPRIGLGPMEIEPLIARSLLAKKWFVEVDEFDRAERLVLNLGHTFGHALESASEYRLSHGVGVGVGILCALALSRELRHGGVGGPAHALELHIRGLLRALPDLGGVLGGIETPGVFERLQSDKKHEPNHYRFITFDGGGLVQLTRLAKTTESRTAVIGALQETLESLRK
jgi:3-dehydroquinate synthase